MTVVTRETIYKRTKTGKVQIWYGQLEGNKYRTISGQEDGKKTESEWTVCEGKNLGRSNETTPRQQAAFELDAMYKKKLEREYHRTKDTIDVERYVKPMKSIKWYDDFKKRPSANVQIALQPKLDGMRCIATEDGMKSQDGKIIPGAVFLNEALKELMQEYIGLALDGELYNHEYCDDFEGLMSLLKKETRTVAEDEEIKQKVQFHIYDLASSAGNYQVRYDLLEGTIMPKLQQHGSMFQLTYTEFHIPSSVAERDQTVEDFNQACLNAHYEGSMVRIVSGKYKNGRTNDMFKVKKFQDDEFLILDVHEGKGNWTGCAKALVVRVPNGESCKATVKGDMEYCRDLWNRREEVKGKMATINFLRYSKKGMLNLPVVKTIRWDV
jgi:ATP-dependent DNA ligase